MTSKPTPKNCPCGTGKLYSQCCEPFHRGSQKPDSPEKLMRSRYSAYVVGNIDYIAKTNDPVGGENFDAEAAEAWSQQSEWLGLEIIAAQGNEVEFRARFKTDGKELVHHEVSLFRFDQKTSTWFYQDGKDIREPIKNIEPKVGRNDSCSCGSGKKFKKCCGKV